MTQNSDSEQAVFFAKFWYTVWYFTKEIRMHLFYYVSIMGIMWFGILYDTIQKVFSCLLMYQFFTVLLIWPIRQTIVIAQKVLKINILNAGWLLKEDEWWLALLQKSETALLSLAQKIHIKIEKINQKTQTQKKPSTQH